MSSGITKPLVISQLCYIFLPCILLYVNYAFCPWYSLLLLLIFALPYITHLFRCPFWKFKHHLPNLPTPDLSPIPNKYISETTQTMGYSWLQWYQDFLIFLIFLCFSLPCNCHCTTGFWPSSFFHCLCFPNQYCGFNSCLYTDTA